MGRLPKIQSLMLTGLLFGFWGVYYLTIGSIPTITIFPFDHEVSRLWDLLLILFPFVSYYWKKWSNVSDFADIIAKPVEWSLIYVLGHLIAYCLAPFMGIVSALMLFSALTIVVMFMMVFLGLNTK